MRLGRHGLRCDGVQRHRPIHPVGCAEAPDHVLAALDDKGRGQHGEDQRRQHDLLHFGSEQPRLPSLEQQHQAELPTGPERETGADCGARIASEQTGQPHDQGRLEHYQRGQQQQHPRPLAPHLAQIQLHPDGDEEQPEQNVLERPDVLLHLVAVLGLGDQHAGEERTERKRQVQLPGEPGEPQREQQQVEHEQLGRLAPRHHVKPGTHHVLAEEQDQGEHHRGLGQRQPEAGGELSSAGRQCRDQDKERDHRQILEQRHPDDLASMQRVQFQPVSQHLAQDGRRGHGQRTAEDHSCLPALPQRQCQTQHQRSDTNHLGRTQTEHQAAHGDQLGQAELQPDAEHQEHHPELCEVAGILGVRHPAQRMRSDQNADDEIADQRRQPQQAAHHDHHYGSGQQQQRDFERVAHQRASGAGRVRTSLEINVSAVEKGPANASV